MIYARISPQLLYVEGVLTTSYKWNFAHAKPLGDFVLRKFWLSGNKLINYEHCLNFSKVVLSIDIYINCVNLLDNLWISSNSQTSTHNIFRKFDVVSLLPGRSRNFHQGNFSCFWKSQYLSSAFILSPQYIFLMSTPKTCSGTQKVSAYLFLNECIQKIFEKYVKAFERGASHILQEFHVRFH